MLRHSSEQPSDIIFQADEDLYQSPSGQIVMLKHSQEKVMITRNRMFQSYIHEFCGLSGLSSSTLKFLVERKEVNPLQVVNAACLIKVQHSADFYNAPNNSLRPALRSIFENNICSDLVIKIDSHRLNANKCILSSRSSVLARLVAYADEIEMAGVRL